MKFKRKKVTKMRGSKTHGWGSKKKHRGSGNRGGKGMAGTGKRGDQKKTWIIKKYGLENYFGKKGFVRRRAKKETKIINVGLLNKILDELVEKKLVKLENNFYVVDLKKIGYDKLLSIGNVDKKIKIISGKVSKRAAEKILNAGGDILVKGE